MHTGLINLFSYNKIILNFAAPIRGIPYESLSLFFSFDINVVNGITDGVKFSETHSSSKLTLQVFCQSVVEVHIPKFRLFKVPTSGAHGL